MILLFIVMLLYIRDTWTRLSTTKEIEMERNITHHTIIPLIYFSRLPLGRYSKQSNIPYICQDKLSLAVFHFPLCIHTVSQKPYYILVSHLHQTDNLFLELINIHTNCVQYIAFSQLRTTVPPLLSSPCSQR